MNSWRTLERRAAGAPGVLAAADMWSCGVSLYVMLSGHLPYLGENEEEILSHIHDEPLNFDGHIWAGISEEAVDLIKNLLRAKPEERLTAQQALAHEWFFGEEDISPEPRAARPVGGMQLHSPARTPAGSLRGWAGGFLRVLRSWRALPKLRRVALIAMARKMEDTHEVRKLAQAAHAVFGENSDRLSCARMVEVLDTALGSPSGPPSATAAEAEALRAQGNPLLPGTLPPAPLGGLSGLASLEAGVAARRAGARLAPPPTITLPPQSADLFTVPGAMPSPASDARAVAYSMASPGSALGRLQGDTRSGFHLRGRIKLLVKSLSGLAEETPTRTPGSCLESSSTPSECRLGGPSPLGASAFSTCSGEFVSHTELRYLVDSLDGQKDGFVDYTLLLASLIPPEVYSEEDRIKEVFELFDLQKRGHVGPQDLCMALLGVGSGSRRWRCRDSLRKMSEMLAEFDLDGDGRLNFNEFRTMVRGL